MTAPTDFHLDFTPLRRTREANSLSLRALASQVGCNHMTLWKLERGLSVRPSLDLVVRLQRKLGVPATEIFHVRDLS